jgi:hypothetical protein
MENTFNIIALVIFVLAILHTFSVKYFQHLASLHPEGSVAENFYHLLGEVEVVFGLWSLILMMFYSYFNGLTYSINYLENLNFTEPLFVFVIMTISSTKPVIKFATNLIFFLSKLLPFNRSLSFYITSLVVGPILGSFITEPAAMTVTAFILLEHFYAAKISTHLKYATIGLLFVNVSVGGALTHFAAPPILMVANTWNWDLAFVFTHFGIEAILSVVISTLTIAFLNKKEISSLNINSKNGSAKLPVWITSFHLMFLAIVIFMAHHPVIFIAAFLFFLGLAIVTKEFQDELKIKEGLLVGFFLAGLVVLGSFQNFWLEPLLNSLNSLTLYLGAMSLTAITDNAALTYLGSQVADLSHDSKIALVSGALVGGGLTVIANAPNPAGFGILNSSFGKEGISPIGLFKSALIPTLIAALIFWFSRLIIH